MATLERAQLLTDEPEPLHWFWVVGPAGVVSTWFSPSTKPVLGYSVCDGASFHSRTERDGFVRVALPCWFFAQRSGALADHVSCWQRRGSMMHVRPISDAFDAGDFEQVWRWLELNYEGELDDE